MNKCNNCQFFDKFGETDGGGCHAMPPTLLRLNDDISEHRPFVMSDDIACSLFKPVNATIGELVATPLAQ